MVELYDDDDLTGPTQVGRRDKVLGEERGPGRLIILTGPQAGRKCEVRETVVIGRSSSATLQLDDPQVSREHVRIQRQPDGNFRLTDLGSRNGVEVNGTPSEQVILRFGDRVKIGVNTLLFVRLDPGEQEVFRRQRLEALGRLSAGVAHDFNNLLGTIVATLEYLRSMEPDHPISATDAQECFEDMDIAARRAADLTRRLLEFARNDGFETRDVNVTRICREAVEIGRRTFSRSISISCDVQEGLLITGDRAQLHQMLMNLLINARDAMEEGGVAQLRAEFRSAEDSALSDGRPSVFISVSDTGKGLEAGIKDKIFTPFFTTKADTGGSGLGLATVKEVVSAHGGLVHVESEVGVGTTFKISLPALLRSGATRVSPTTREFVRPRLSTPLVATTVMVVDDEAMLRRSLRRLLKQRGYTVVEAASGQEALELYSTLTEPPSLILMDLDMPGMRGDEAHRALVELNPYVRVVFVSGGLDTERERELRNQGAIGFLQKPFEAASLDDVLMGALSG